MLSRFSRVQHFLTVCTSLLSLWDSPGKNAGVGSQSLLWGIFLTQGLNPCLLHCRQILNWLSHWRNLNVIRLYIKQPSYIIHIRASQVALVVKNLPANAGDIRDEGLIPGLGRSPGVGNGNPLRYSCLEIPWTEEPGRLQPQGHKELDTTEAH